MAIIWNGVEFRETGVVDGGPDFSFLPSQESRYQMRGWFDWQDMVQPLVNGTQLPSPAAKAYAGWCQSRSADGYQPIDANGNPIAAVANPAPPAGGTGITFFNYTNPFAHPDWPNQMYLCEGFGSVKGDLPATPGIGPNQTAVFDKAKTTLHFRSPKNGYRTLWDFQCLDRIPWQNENGLQGTIFVPREYFCTRNMEITQDTTARSQTVPPDAGLQWQAVQNGLIVTKNVSSMNFVTLTEAEITLVWYPVPLFGYNEDAANELIGKTNSDWFPPLQTNWPGIPATSSFLKRWAPFTLVFGQPKKEIVRMGDSGWAAKITMKMKGFVHGANSFFWWNPPANWTGRIRIDATGNPIVDRTLGGPGYYFVARPDHSTLYPSADYRQAFLPKGQAA